MDLRQVLKCLRKTYKGKAKVREILEKYRNKLSKRDCDIIQYAYIEKLSNLNVADKIGLSVSQYQAVLNTTLAKLDLLIDDKTFREMVELVKLP